MPSSRPTGDVVRFLGYALDAGDAQLWRGAEVVPLRPKTLAVLTHLVSHAGRLVTKGELLDAIWPDTAVSESVLTSCVKELRRALDDDPRQPRAIETAHRHGYRFIAHIESGPESPAGAARGPDGDAGLLGRAAAIAELESWLEAARAGRRQIGFVAGEAGIGKTALTECFLDRLAAGDGAASGAAGVDGGHGAVLIARGQCVEQHGAGEPYLPVLDALARLCAGERGEALRELLHRHAPTWLLQLPALVDSDEVAVLERRAAGGARMPRELASFVEALADPLVLLLEDLHWSDHATVDLLSILAQRHEPARLLVLATYRPVDLVVGDHPLRRLVQQLRQRGVCNDLWLQPLRDGDVAAYVGARWPGLGDDSAVARTLYERTDGNPLFLVSVAEYLVATGAVARSDGRWSLRAAASDIGKAVPLGLRQMIAAQLDRIAPLEREMLEAGSLAGRTFSAALVAAALDCEVVEVERQLSRLAASEHFVRAAGRSEWPDGTVAGAYQLSHSLYRSVLGDAVPPARSRQLHGRIAARLERAYENRSEEIGAELAYHFERSGDVDRAVPYLEQSAARAVRRAAAHEAVAALRHALDLLDAMPESRQRDSRTIGVCIALGGALPALNGYADPEIERSFLRARRLSEANDDGILLFQSLVALTANYVARAHLADAREAAAAIERLMSSMRLPLLEFGGHLVIGIERFHAGTLAEAREHLEQARALRGLPLPALSQDLEVVLLNYLALTLAHQGHPDEARATSDEAAARAAEVGRPFDRGSSAQVGCFLYLLLRDMPALARAAAQAVAEGTEHHLPAIRAIGRIGQGRVLAADGRHQEGVAMMRDGIEAYRQSGQRISLPSVLGALASTHLAAGDAGSAAAVLDEALALVDETAESRFAPELHRLRGEAHRRRDELDAASRCFDRALDLARETGGRWWELRAATSLADLQMARRRRAAARTLLAPICESFDRVSALPDVAAARALLAELS